MTRGASLRELRGAEDEQPRLAGVHHRPGHGRARHGHRGRPARSHTRSDRSGYIDVRIRDHGLEPGWHDVTIDAEGAEPVRGRCMVVGTDVTFGLVSDIDDTVISPSLPRPMIAAWNTFVKHESARHVVPGMAPMYRELLAEHPGAPIVYLSTGAWNTAPTLNRFLARHGYPAGPLLLTDWGPTNTGWFRSGQEHKRARCTGWPRSSRRSAGSSSATTASTTRRSTATSPSTAPRSSRPSPSGS